jgi:TPP-dependent pyruvate/acetoin dehydrogenase alpha subunit
MDVLEVESAAQKAADSIRAGKGPHFLECQTYRFRAHSMFDPELYREKKEVNAWKKKCPIATFTRHLKDQGLLNDAHLKKLEKDVDAEIEKSVAYAEAGTWEPLEDLVRFVYSEGGKA